MSMTLKTLLLVTHLVAAALLTGCGEDDRQAEIDNMSSEEHVLKAQLLIDRRQGKAAINELKMALQKDNTNAEAAFVLGELYFQNQEMTSADKELNRASDLGYDTSEVKTLLARVYLAQGKNKPLQAIKAERLRGQDRATVMALQGLSLVNIGSTEKGKELVAQAVRLAPSNEEARLTLARLLATKKDLKGTREQVEAILVHNDTNFGALMLLGHIEFLEGRLEAAEEAYGRAMEAAVNPTEAQLKRAQVRVEKKDFEQAQADADEMLARYPNSPSVHYVQALIHFEQQLFEEAISSLAIAEKDLERHPEALLYAGISHNKLGNYDQARNYANQFHNLQPRNAYGRRLLAMVAMSSGAHDEAEQELQTLVDANPGDVASMNLLANSLLAQGNTEAGLELLAKVAELQPDSSIALGRLAAGRLLAGDQYMGVWQLEEALAIDPGFEQAEILLVLNFVRQKDYSKALAAAEAYRQRNPNNTRPLNLLGRVYLAQRQKPKARQAFLDVLEIEPAEATANHGLAQMAMDEGDFGKAQAYYDTVLAENEDYLPTLLKLAEMAARQNQVKTMVTYLQRAMELHPDQLAPRVMMAQYYLGINRSGKVEFLFSGMSEDMRNHSEVLKVVAMAQLAEKDYLGAKFSIGKLADRQPRSAQVHYLWALLHAALDEPEQQEQELLETLDISPDYLPPRFMIARMYLSQGKNDRARPHLDKLEEMVPSSPELLLLKAASARMRGNQQEAVAFAEEAFAAASTTTTLLHLVGYLHQQGNFEREQALLKQWLAEYPDDIQARMAQANTSALRENFTAAISQYREVLKREEDHLMALNNLAWYLREREPEQALTYAQRAAELDPDSVATQDTLAIVLLNNGELKKAGWAINRAKEQDPTNPSVRYHSALISARAGKREVALEELEPLLASGDVFSERADAVALLQELKGG